MGLIRERAAQILSGTILVFYKRRHERNNNINFQHEIE